MINPNVGVEGQFKHSQINIKNTHCAIHQFQLCAKKIGLNETIEVLTKIVNKIKGGHNALIHRKFKSFLEEIESDYDDLKYYTEVRWLSKATFLERLFKMRNDVKLFIEVTDKLKHLKLHSKKIHF